LDESNELMKDRIRTIHEIRELGYDPFSSEPFEVTHSVEDIVTRYGNADAEALKQSPVECRIAGRIIGLRNFGKAAFAHIQDGSGSIQVFFQKDQLPETYALFKKLNTGDIIGLEGSLFRTKTNELTVNIKSFRLLTKSIRPLPEKWHGLSDIETRYRQRYVDLIVNPEVRRTFRRRTQIVLSIRKFLDSKGFIEVETPMMQSIPGGATAKPFRTHHNALGIDLFLRIAPELHLKRLLVGGFERVYEINRNFRNEGISARHNPEFTMVEFYMAYADYGIMMDFVQELLCHVVSDTIGSLRVTYGETTIDFSPPWPRIRMMEALREAGVPEDALSGLEAAKAWGGSRGIDMREVHSLGKALDEIFSEIIEPQLVQPTFVIDHPVELSPLAKRKKDEPNLVERFELFVSGREIANAFSELNDPFDQRKRFEEQVKDREKGDDEAHLMDDDYVRALEYGMPPAAGAGIGVDRLVMILTNSNSIRDVILFPQLKPEA